MDLEIDVESLSETTKLDFKSQFDPESRQDWCEIVKDIVAMANSGGGYIFFGVNDDGTLSGVDISIIVQMDAADITNKVHSYTEQQLGGISILPAIRNNQPIAIMKILGVKIPIIFTSPGTYQTSPNTQKTAFSKGTIYFRHGPKSEPGTSDDLRESIERELERVKGFWLGGIAKVVEAPPGSTVQIVKHEYRYGDSPESTSMRLTYDDTAPAFKAIQADKIYPYRQKEVLLIVLERLGEKIIGPHDLHCVRHVYNLDNNPTFTYKSLWSPRQYSDAFVDWLIQQYQADKNYFKKARETYHKMVYENK